MRLPRMTTRRWMIAVAIVGLVLGGSLELVRLRRLSHEYAGRAINARRALANARMSSGWNHERWLAECRRIEESERKWTTGYPMSTGRPFRPSVARAYIAYWEPIFSKYERAAAYPWLPLEPDPPRPEP
jgi:hypothetical protein